MSDSQGAHDDHNVVDTKHGPAAVLPDTDKVVPIHWADDADVLMPGGHWTIAALEDVIGRPGEYASRIVRLFVVPSEKTVDDIDIPGLANLLSRYAAAHNLSIKLTTYRGGRSENGYFNTKDDSQQWISIDILTKEIIALLATRVDPGTAIMQDMHLAPNPRYGFGDPTNPHKINVDLMASGCHMQMPRNTLYDYNTLVVHRVVDGKPIRTEYPINMIHFRG